MTKREAAAAGRRESEQLLKQKSDLTQGDNARRLKAYQSVRTMHEQQHAKAARQQQQLELRLRQNFESKMSGEKQRKAAAESLIAKFEAEEAKLIERLKGTQSTHQSELSKLEQSLITP